MSFPLRATSSHSGHSSRIRSPMTPQAINPHLFRDAAATTLAIADPAHVRVAAPQGKAGPTSARVT